MKLVETALTTPEAKPPAGGQADHGLREKAMQSLSKLPPFSPILNKLVASLSDEDVSFSQLSDLIEKDTVLAGNVLRLVNSALYGRNGTVNSVRRAVSLIGLAKLRNVAMSVSLTRLWNSSGASGWSPAPFNEHAVAAAILADLLAAELPVEYPEGAFTAGLLENLGMMLIALGLPEQRSKIQQSYSVGTAPLADCEREVLGFDHAALSSDVLRQWNLPKPIQEAVGQHESPGPAPGAMGLGHLLYQVDLIAAQLGIVAQPWLRPADGSPQETLESLGVSGSVLESFKIEYETIRGMFHS